jgi:molybdenum cofactor guanylyltransferase
MILGLILAGGQATRMGGGDKALLKIGEETVLSLLIARLSLQVDALILNANGDATRFESFHLPVVKDSLEAFQGPLAGILAGLDYAQEQGFTHMLSVAGDTPFLPRTLVARLQAAGDMASVSSNNQTHPVIGLWPVRCAAPLRAFLATNQRKIDKFTAQHGCVYVDFQHPSYDPFFNINTKEELEFAQKIAITLQQEETTL